MDTKGISNQNTLNVIVSFARTDIVNYHFYLVITVSSDIALNVAAVSVPVNYPWHKL